MEDASVEENLENEDELQESLMHYPEWMHLTTPSVSDKTTYTTNMLLKLQAINMKRPRLARLDFGLFFFKNSMW